MRSINSHCDRARQFFPVPSLSPGHSDSSPDVQSPESYTRSAPHSGYLGPTSFVAPLQGGSGLSYHSDAARISDDAQVLPSYWLQRASEALQVSSDWPILEQLVREYYVVTQAAVIPEPLVLSTLLSLREMQERFALNKDSGNDCQALTNSVIENTARPFDVPSTQDGYSFHTLFTGKRVRLEIMGFVYALAGKASLLDRAANRFQESGPPSRVEFARRMLHASDTVLQLCKMIAQVNDLTIWLLYENLLLASMLNGDLSEFPLELEHHGANTCRLVRMETTG